MVLRRGPVAVQLTGLMAVTDGHQQVVRVVGVCHLWILWEAFYVLRGRINHHSGFVWCALSVDPRTDLASRRRNYWEQRSHFHHSIFSAALRSTAAGRHLHERRTGNSKIGHITRSSLSSNRRGTADWNTAWRPNELMYVCVSEWII